MRQIWNRAIIAGTLGVLTLTVAVQAQSDSQVTITYLANEGVQLAAGPDSVLIDALFRDGVRGYARLEPATLEKIENAQAPFDTVKLVLVTHLHADHFDADSVAAHLTHNPAAVLVTSKQVADPVRLKLTDPTVQARINSYQPNPKEVVNVDGTGLSVELLRLSHGGGRFAKIWNLGYVVHIGGKRILHLGDADLNPATTKPLKAHAIGVDVACIPYWWLQSTDSQLFVTRVLKPKQIIAIHIPPAEAEQIKNQIQPLFPKAVLFTAPNQTYQP